MMTTLSVIIPDFQFGSSTMLSSILEFEGETSTIFLPYDHLQREFEVNDVHKTIINNKHASAVVFLLTFPMQSNNNNSSTSAVCSNCSR